MPEKPIEILLLEDNCGDAELIRLGLSEAKTDFAVRHASRLSEALELLRQGPIDAIIADLSLPDSSGLETVSRLRERVPHVAIVVLTGLADDDVAMASLDRGAQDYLVKGRITPDVIDRAVRYAMQRQQNAEMRGLVEQVRASERLMAKKNRHLARLYRTAHHSVDNVSHEFRTPLTVIGEYASLLREGIVGPVTPEQSQMLDVVTDRADDLNTMVDDMLNVSKLEAGLLSLDREVCRVSDIVDRVRPLLDRKAAIRHAQWTVDIENGLPEVYCDAEKIRGVIVNLVDNALKACGDHGQVRLWARHDGFAALVGVTDNGEGLDDQQLRAVARRFNQATAQPLGGSKVFRLGLSIAKELVDLNLGRMSVDSRLGVGSTFSFTLPLAQCDSIVPRYLDWLQRGRRRPLSVSLLTADVETSSASTLANETHAFLHRVLRHKDLLLRANAQRWLLILPHDGAKSEQFVSRLQQAREDLNQARPQGPLPAVAMRIEATYTIPTHQHDALAHVERLISSSTCPPRECSGAVS